MLKGRLTPCRRRYRENPSFRGSLRRDIGRVGGSDQRFRNRCSHQNHEQHTPEPGQGRWCALYDVRMGCVHAHFCGYAGALPGDEMNVSNRS
jgi:hypothetical protein